MTDTVWSLFFADVDVAARIQQLARDSKLDGQLSRPAKATLAAGGHALTNAIREAMDIPISKVLAAGWATHQALHDLVERSDPASRVTYTLGEHAISSEHHPRMELKAAEQTIATITLDLEFALNFELGVLHILNGRVMSAETGTTVGEAKLSAYGVLLGSRATEKLPLPGVFEFGEGIPLPYHTRV